MPTIRIEGRVSRVPEQVRENIRDRMIAEVAKLRGIEPDRITVLWIGTERGSTPDIVVQIIGTFPVLEKGQEVCDLLQKIFQKELPDMGGSIRKIKLFCDRQNRSTDRAYAVIDVCEPAAHDYLTGE